MEEEIMKKRSILAIVLSVALVAAMSIGCGQKPGDTGQSPSPTNTGGAQAESKELDMFWFADGAETQSMQKLIDQYQKDNTNIKINLLEVPYDEIINKILMSVSGGEAPALARTTESVLGAVYDATVDIGDYVDNKEEFLGQFMESIHQRQDLRRTHRRYSQRHDLQQNGI